MLRRMLPVRSSEKRTSVASPHNIQDAVREAARPFVPEHAEQFSQNLVQFLKFRGTLSAWDQQFMRQQVRMQRCSAHGHSSDGAAPAAIHGSGLMDL